MKTKIEITTKRYQTNVEVFISDADNVANYGFSINTEYRRYIGEVVQELGFIINKNSGELHKWSKSQLTSAARYIVSASIH